MLLHRSSNIILVSFILLLIYFNGRHVLEVNCQKDSYLYICYLMIINFPYNDIFGRNRIILTFNTITKLVSLSACIIIIIRNIHISPSPNSEIHPQDCCMSTSYIQLLYIYIYNSPGSERTPTSTCHIAWVNSMLSFWFLQYSFSCLL